MYQAMGMVSGMPPSMPLQGRSLNWGPMPFEPPQVPVYPAYTPYNPLPNPPVSINQAIAQYQDLQRRRKEIPEDRLLDYTFLDKILQGFKTTFVTVPKTVWKGLKGEKDFTFADAMLVAKVPYYIGGAVLALSPFVGGNKAEGVRWTAAMLLYLLGSSSANFLINTAYRLRYGVDLTKMYRSKTGQIEHVYISSDFPRFDLLGPEEYQRLEKKLGVPEDVYEPDGAIREQLRRIIPSSRTLKLILANLCSAIGAGYIARSPAWTEVSDGLSKLSSVWKEPASTLSVLQKVEATLRSIAGAFRPVFENRFKMMDAEPWQRLVVYGWLAAIAASVGYVFLRGLPKKHYSSTGVSPLAQYALQHPQAPFQQILYPNLSAESFLTRGGRYQ